MDFNHITEKIHNSTTKYKNSIGNKPLKPQIPASQHLREEFLSLD